MIFNKKNLIIAGLLFSTIAKAEITHEDWNAKFQSTYVWQKDAAFHSSYASINSLSQDSFKSYSFTATAALEFVFGKGLNYILIQKLPKGWNFQI